jgi:hypothetical protein
VTSSRVLAAAGFVLAALVLSAHPINAQDDLSSKISQFLGENGTMYVQPAISSFSANLNSGIFQSADVHGLLGFEVDLVAMFAPVPDDKKTFQASIPPTIRDPADSNKIYFAGRDYDQVVVTPTALGQKTGTKVFTKGGTPVEVFQFPGGADLKLVPLVVPQLKVGGPVGTELIIRYVPEVTLNDAVGKLSLVGIGAKHSVSQWLPGPSVTGAARPGSFPLDISVGLMYQVFSIRDTAGGDFVKTKAFSIGAQASKNILFFTFYGGIAYETATTTISYNYRPTVPEVVEVAPQQVNLEGIRGDNTFRITGGLKFHWLMINVFADYSVASQPVVSAGLALSF